MTAPIKPKKTHRNQPPKFDEALGGFFPVTPPNLDIAAPHRNTNDHPQYLVISLIWILATLAAGAGIGFSIKARSYPSLPSEPPAPVASALVEVRELSPVSASFAVSDANNLFVTTNGVTLQPAGQTDALHPIWSQFLTVQGTLGIAAVR